MHEQKKPVESHLLSGERGEWERPEVTRLEAGDAEATRGGLGSDAVYS